MALKKSPSYMSIDIENWVIIQLMKSSGLRLIQNLQNKLEIFVFTATKNVLLQRDVFLV